MTDQPRKTLSLKKTIPTEEEGSEAPLTRKRSGKRLIRREQLPQQSMANTKTPSKKLAKKQQKTKKVTTHFKKPVTPPSHLRVAALDKQLSEAFTVWRDSQPLALGIEKSIFRFIAEHHISASKRVVQKLLRHHTSNQIYRNNVQKQTQRLYLDGTPAGVISQIEKDYAQRQLAGEHSALD